MTKQQKRQEDILQIEMSIIDRYKKPFLGACAALVVIVAAVAGWNWYSDKANQEALAELYSGEAYFRVGQYGMALNGDSIGYAGFVVLSESNTKAGNLACMYAGLSYAQENQWENAIEYLEKYNPKDDHTLTPAALRVLGNCYANIGDTKKAVKNLEKAAKKASGNTLTVVCLMEAAEIYESIGEKDKARSIYEDIKEKYPETPQGIAIDKYLQRLN